MGGTVILTGTILEATVPGDIPPGFYRLRLLALTAGGAPIGTFSPALFVQIR